MCTKPRIPKTPPAPSAPPVAQKAATQVGRSQAAQQNALNPNSLKRFALNLNNPFSLPS